MGERTFAQEYLCEFREAREKVFDMDVVRRLVSNAVEPRVID